jgi:two-component system, LytTR family, response regulator
VEGGRVRIRALVVDDEPLAREHIRMLLEGETDVAVVGECRDGAEAVAAIRRDKPDLVFLDVQMPELDGLEVVEHLGPADLPAVVFVTAYDRHALRAFDLHAVDYLLKPFDRSRFHKALRKARAELLHETRSAIARRLEALIEDLKAPAVPLERVVIRCSGRILFVKTEQIAWIEAEGNYVRVAVGGDTHLLRETLSALERRLDPGRFVRIHRCSIVNIDRVRELHPLFHGDFTVVMEGGKRLTLSRSHRRKLDEVLRSAS